MNYQLRFQSRYSFALLSVAHVRSVSVCLSVLLTTSAYSS